MPGKRGKMPGKRPSNVPDVDEELKKNILKKIASTQFKNYTLGRYLENNMKALEAIANKAMKYNDVFKLKGFSPYMRAYHLKKVPILKTVAEVKMITCPYCFRDVTLESCRVDHVIPVQVYTRYLHLLLAEKKASDGAHDLKALQTERQNVIKKTLPSRGKIPTFDYIQELIKKTQDDYVTVDSLSGEIRRSFSRHHLVERAHNEYFNLILCCHTCNSKKSNALNIDNVLMVSEAYANKKNAPALAFKISSIRKVLNKINDLSDPYLCYVTESPKAVGMTPYFTGEGKTDPPTKAKSSFTPSYSEDVRNDPDMFRLIANPAQYLKSANISDKRNRSHSYSPPEDENITEKEGEEPEKEPGKEPEKKPRKRHTRGDTLREAALSAEAETPASEAVREYLELISNEVENSKRSGLSASYIDKSLKNFNSLFNEHLTGDGADFSIIKESLEKSTELKDEGTEIKDEGTEIKDEGTEIKDEGAEIKEEGAEIKDEGMEIEDEGTERKGDGTELENDAPQEKVHIKKSLLKHQITTSGVKTFHGKICLYCLGVYEESAFELDHIKPVSAHKHALSAGLYNEVINIVAVCKTCNTSKGPRPLTTKFLTERQGMIREAGNTFCFRLEHAINPGTSKNYTLEEGKDIRKNMLDGLIASI